MVFELLANISVRNVRLWSELCWRFSLHELAELSGLDTTGLVFPLEQRYLPRDVYKMIHSKAADGSAKFIHFSSNELFYFH